MPGDFRFSWLESKSTKTLESNIIIIFIFNTENICTGKALFKGRNKITKP